MELLVVILFFMLASTIVMQVFLAAHQKGGKAATVTEALNEVQNIADLLYCSDDAETVLSEAGFERTGEEWTKPSGTCVLHAASHDETSETGVSASTASTRRCSAYTS